MSAADAAPAASAGTPDTRAAAPATAAGSAIGGIKRNTAWLLAGRILALSFGVLFTVVLARRIGPAGFGAYAFVAAAVLIANVVTTFGTDMVLIRDAAAGSGLERWGAALYVQLGLSAIAIGGAWAVAPLVPDLSPGTADALRVYVLSLVPAALFSVCTAALRGSDRMGGYAALGAIVGALQLAAVAVLVAPGAPLVGVMVVLLAVQVAAAAVAWFLCAYRLAAFRQPPRASVDGVIEMLGATGTIGLLGLLGMAYQRAAILALAALSGPAMTGWFAGASRIIEASKTGHVALFGALYPAMAAAHGSDRQRSSGAPADRSRRPAERELRWASRASTLGAILISFGLLGASSFAVGILYGPAFAPSAQALSILALSVLPSALSTYQSLDLVARRREALTLRAQVLSLAALLGLLGLLVPAIGWLGACWAVLGAELVQVAALFAARRGLETANAPHGAVRAAGGAS